MSESLREKPFKRVVVGLVGVLLTATAATGCSTAIESEAATRDLGSCGSIAAFGDMQKDAEPIDDISGLSTSVQENLSDLEEFIAASGVDRFRIDNPDNDNSSNVGYVELTVTDNELILGTNSLNDSGADKLVFSKAEDGTISPISYGAIACSEDTTLYPSRAVEFIDALATSARSASGGEAR